MEPANQPIVHIVMTLNRGHVLECGGKRWYERTGVRRQQYSTLAKSWTMDQDCYNICTKFMCEFVVYHTPDGIVCAPFDHVWKSVQLHATAGIKRFPKVWFKGLLEMISMNKEEPEPPEYLPVEEPPTINFEEA